MADVELSVTHTLTLTSNNILSVFHRRIGTINQLVPIFQTLTAVLIPDPNRLGISTDVTIGQTISIDTVKQIITTVSASQTISRVIERSTSLIQDVPINQTLIAYLDKGVSGNSGKIFVDPAVVAFEAGLTPPVEIMFTCVNADALPDPINTHINLRKPEFGDSDDYQQFRVERQSLGGDLQIFQDEMWPSTEKIELKFNYLSEDVASDLLAYLTKTLGQLHTFHDQFGRTLTGYIITPFEKILQPKVAGWSASFTFQIWTEPNEIT